MSTSPLPQSTRPDFAALREDFPILHQQVHGKPLAYLDNAASSQRPRQVIDAVTHYEEHDHANIHRGVHTLSQRATDAFEGARKRIAGFINAASERETIFTRGTTEAINLVAQAYARPRLQPGDQVLITWMEHHSNIVPWQMVCGQTGAELVVAPIDKRGQLRLDEFERLLGPRTRFVAAVHVSNALGTINPVAEMITLAHDRGVPVLLDGAQAVPHGSVDVQALGCDFYAFSGHKVFAPTGIGALWARREILEELGPWQGGGGMIASVSFEKTTWAGVPDRFEAGSPNTGGAVGLAAALEYLEAAGAEAVAHHERALVEHAEAALREIPGLRLIGEPADRASVISFVMEGIHAHDLGTILDREGVAVRAGHHCAQPLMERYGVPATVRASFALYNTREDVDALLAGLHAAREIFGA